jgi:hypothetical protein
LVRPFASIVGSVPPPLPEELPEPPLLEPDPPLLDPEPPLLPPEEPPDEPPELPPDPDPLPLSKPASLPGLFPEPPPELLDEQAALATKAHTSAETETTEARRMDDPPMDGAMSAGGVSSKPRGS